MIHTRIVRMRSGETNLGAYYNSEMARVKIDDWVCFIDDDAIFTTGKWLEQLHEYVDKYPHAGMFTCCTNRVYNKRQLVNGAMNESHDMRDHRLIGKRLANNFYTDVEILNANAAISGVLMMIKKRVWKNCRFSEGFFGVDNQIHRDLAKQGYKVYLMKGLYVYHWYRGDGDHTHVKKMRALYG